jgi:hypothetical protein
MLRLLSHLGPDNDHATPVEFVMESTRVPHDPHSHTRSPSPSFLIEDSSELSLPVPSAPFDLYTSPVDDLVPPPSFDSMNFFSSHEQDDMLDFLRDFDAADPWEFNPMLPSRMPVYPGGGVVEEPNYLYNASVGPTAADRDHSGIADSSSVASVHSSAARILSDTQTTPQGHRPSPPSTLVQQPYQSVAILQPQQGQSNHHAMTGSSNHSDGQSHGADFRPKPLLSAPQKRMNHVKSEKRRRDTIRDGYLILTRLLSPSGPGAEQLAIPRRGRPKGSGRPGVGGKKTGKGKSGVLFRAVEYIRFMEEACESLEQECERLERLVLSTSMHQQPGYQTGQYGHPW